MKKKTLSYKKFAKSVLELIGQTPTVKLNKITTSDMAEILAKLENFNPAGSLKDRVCLAMVEDAEKKGLLKKGFTIIEPTSGNTGIGLAMISAVKGYRCILVMPSNVSCERISILKLYGAELVLTDKKDGMLGAVKKAQELIKQIPNSVMLQQFRNPANPKIHKLTTAKEILEVTSGKLDAFVAGVGTGGTISGVGEILKKKNQKIKIIAVEPKKSSVLSGGSPGVHNIQGIGAGFIPEILNRKVIDEVIAVDDEDAIKMTKRLAQEEGLAVGISSGAVCFVALEVAKKLGKGKRVVTIFADSAERNLSILKDYLD